MYEYINCDSRCESRQRMSQSRKTPGDNGFSIKLLGKPPPQRYTPNQVYTVSITGQYRSQSFLNFQLLVTPENAVTDDFPMGTLQKISDDTSPSSELCPHIFSRSKEDIDRRESVPQVNVLWTAPPDGSGCVEIKATILVTKDIWYQDDGALTRVFCQQGGVNEEDKSSSMIPDCCACDVAKYELEFEGIWSRESHPKDFPYNKRLLHWSNIVGATHSKEFTLWSYGGYSSRGIKDLCEYGYPRALENEIKTNANHVRTVIQASGIWWSDDDGGLKQKRHARYSADKRHHLLSLASMVGPSPDWCVGLSSFDLCLPNCTWKQSLDIALVPWDAGTDDGISFLSRNKLSVPQQKIHRITSTFPSNPASPFYTGSTDLPIKPLAKLRLKRVNSETSDADCSKVQVAGVDFIRADKDLIKIKSRNADGKKLFSKNKNKGPMSFETELSEAEKELFLQGNRNRIFTNEIKTKVSCDITEWSDWTPCSKTCEQGVRRRSRVYMQDNHDDCEVNTMQFESCNLHNCRNNLTTTTTQRIQYVTEHVSNKIPPKNITELCFQPLSTGGCYSSLRQWRYDSKERRCRTFRYSGCGGNNNRFLTKKECVKLCKRRLQLERKKWKILNRKMSDDHKRLKKRNCKLSSWSEWTPCPKSKSCGKNYRTKRRMILREALNGGVECSQRKLEKRRKCPSHKCKSRDCRMTSWTNWSSCIKTCGLDTIQERSRKIARVPKKGGLPCAPNLQRRYCNLPLCIKDQ